MNSTSVCPPFPTKPSRCEVLIEVERGASILSLCGCLLVFFLIWLLRKYKHSSSQRLIFWLTFGGFFLAIAGILAGADWSSVMCITIAIAVQMSNAFIMIRVSCIGFNVAWNVVLQCETTSRLEWIYHTISWSYALLMAAIPLAFDAYGNTGGWCWITGDHLVLRFAVFYGPLYAILLALIITYVFIFRKFARAAHLWDGSYHPDREEEKLQLRSSARTLLAYPIVFVILAIFPFTNHVYQAAKGEENTLYSLAILHAISSPLIGAVNALAYALDKQTLAVVRSRGIGRLLKFRLRRKRRSESIQTYKFDEDGDDESCFQGSRIFEEHDVNSYQLWE